MPGIPAGLHLLDALLAHGQEQLLAESKVNRCRECECPSSCSSFCLCTGMEIDCKFDFTSHMVFSSTFHASLFAPFIFYALLLVQPFPCVSHSPSLSPSLSLSLSPLSFILLLLSLSFFPSLLILSQIAVGAFSCRQATIALAGCACTYHTFREVLANQRTE